MSDCPVLPLKSVKYLERKGLFHASSNILPEYYDRPQCSVRFPDSGSISIPYKSGSSPYNRQQASHHSYRYGRMGRVIPFFIERWENAKRKPLFHVENMESMNHKEIEIEVCFPDKSKESRKGRFHFVIVANHGEDSAIDVKPHLSILDVPRRVHGLLPMVMIRPNPFEPKVVVEWTKDKKEFEALGEGRFAAALIQDVIWEKSIPSLDGFGGAEGFALAFSVRGSDGVFLPTTPQAIKIPLEHSFGLGLNFRASGLPIYLSKVYRVASLPDDRLVVTEARDPAEVEPNLRIGYLSAKQFPKKH